MNLLADTVETLQTATFWVAVLRIATLILNAVLPGEERFLSAPAKNED